MKGPTPISIKVIVKIKHNFNSGIRTSERVIKNFHFVYNHLLFRDKETTGEIESVLLVSELKDLEGLHEVRTNTVAFFGVRFCAG
jgi:hypothetical protein